METDGVCKRELTMEELPDSLLLQIFRFLPYQTVLAVSSTCSRFNSVAQDDLLWRIMFRRDFKVDKSISLRRNVTSWFGEYRRLVDDSPAVMYQKIKSHRDQVLHVSFSHDGTMFATCSKDGKIMVWDATKFPHERKFVANLTKELSWRYTQFSQFNKSDTLLLVSGVQSGLSSAGEITVFDLQNFELQCRVENKPYDVFGCWYNDEHLFSGTLYWTGHFRSISALWLSKASQEVESERESVTKIIYRFANHAYSSVRTIMVADVPVVHNGNQPTSLCRKCGLLFSNAGSIGSEGLCENKDFAGDSGDSVEENVNNNNVFQYRSLLEWIFRGSWTDWRMLDGEVLSVEGAEANSLSHSGSPTSQLPLDSPSSTSQVGYSPTRSYKDYADIEANAAWQEEEDGSREEGSLAGAKGLEARAGDPSNCKSSTSSPANDYLSSLRCCCRKADITKEAGAAGSRVSGQGADGVRQRRNFEWDVCSSSESAHTSNLRSPDSSFTASPSARSRAPYAACENGTQLLHCPCIPRTHSTPKMQGFQLKTRKLLIFTMGNLTYSPHLIGFKWINLSDIRGQEATEAELRGLEDHLLPYVDENNHNQNVTPSTDPDVTIDMEGHIVGMALSPDQRFLYVNCRQWPQNFVIDDPKLPPPIAQEIDIRVIDLLMFKEVGMIMRSHKAFTPNDECFFLFLDVSDLYVASGAEDKRGYLWDRHYGCHLRTFAHRDVVNCVSFNPQDEEMLITVSDDYEILVWRSRRWMREEKDRLEMKMSAQVGTRETKNNEKLLLTSNHCGPKFVR